MPTCRIGSNVNVIIYLIHGLCAGVEPSGPDGPAVSAAHPPPPQPPPACLPTARQPPTAVQVRPGARARVPIQGRHRHLPRRPAGWALVHPADRAEHGGGCGRGGGESGGGEGSGRWVAHMCLKAKSSNRLKTHLHPCLLSIPCTLYPVPSQLYPSQPPQFHFAFLSFVLPV
jgi:hypothetical protein